VGLGAKRVTVGVSMTLSYSPRRRLSLKSDLSAFSFAVTPAHERRAGGLRRCFCFIFTVKSV